MQEEQTSKIAVFIDFENVAIGADKQFDDFDLGLILKAVQRRGRVTIKRAYGDWSRLSRYRETLRENAVELVQLYSSPQHGKNRADIRLVIDVMECMFNLEYIDIIVIVSGDSDFSPLMSRSREYGKYTIGVGVKASTSETLTKACDEFIFYDELLEASYQANLARREEPLPEAAPELPVEPPPVSPEKALRKPAPQPAPPPPVVKRSPPPITVISSSLSVPAAPPVNYSERDALQYFFEDIRLPLLPADVRQKILSDLLEAAAPGKTLNQVINAVKVKYDYGNVYGKREDIRLVAKLACRAGVFEFGKERPSLAAYLRRVAASDPKQAAYLTDQALLRISLEANFSLSLPGATQAFFAPMHDEGRCEDLLENLLRQGLIEQIGEQYRVKTTDTVNRLLQAPELMAVKRDLDGIMFAPSEERTRAKADDLLTKASDVRRNFSLSSQLGLRGLRMLADLYQRREKGLGVDEFLWRTAACCAARAGVSFHNHDYFTARQHYLAFFWILQEGEMAWEMLRSLTPHMLSYYWMTLSHELDFFVSSFSGQSPPSETVMAIVHVLDDAEQEKLAQLAYNLAIVNAGQLRSLIEQIETELPSPEQQTALALLKATHERFLTG
jgi:uncharacterized protein (TIGR00288 family)